MSGFLNNMSCNPFLIHCSGNMTMHSRTWVLLITTETMWSMLGPTTCTTAITVPPSGLNETMEKRSYISDVFLGFRQVPHFIIAVRHGEGTNVRILRTTINAAKFDDLVENVRLGPKCKSFIINRDGQYQTRARSGNNEMETMDPNFWKTPFSTVSGCGKSTGRELA